MKLDRETYEVWLLDRMDGLLSPARVKELEAFLQANPDLHADVGGLPIVKRDSVEFPLKDTLRKAYPPAGIPDGARLDDFLAARAEQDLSVAQEKQLDRYLYEHPQADRDAALMALAKVQKEAIVFTEKDSVQRHFPPKGLPDDHRLADFLIAELEGDLNAEQQHALKRYLDEHAEARHEQEMVAATSVAKTPISFPGKEKLKKREVRVVALWPRLAAAACFLLLVGAGWWSLREKRAEGKEVARVEKPAEARELRPKAHEVQPAVAEHPTASEGNGLAPKERLPKRKNGSAAEVRATPPETDRPGTKPMGQMDKAPAPTTRPAPEPVPQMIPLEEPVLAQHVEQPSTPSPTLPQAVKGTVPAEKLAAPTVARTQGSTQDLGTFVANTLRGKILETPERGTELDGSDVLAFADKAIGAVTGGQGGVEVEQTSTGKRFQLRLGRNLSFSASSGR